MKQGNIIKGETEDEIWHQMKELFRQSSDIFECDATIIHGQRKILLSIDVDLGGGFESGYETTTLTSELQKVPEFLFAIHEENFIDEIGKFFGMQDVVIGYKEFDDKLIIKTNDKAKTRRLFSNFETRKIFISLSDFTFGITAHSADNPQHKNAYLEFNIERAITDAKLLREIYTVFFSTLQMIDS